MLRVSKMQTTAVLVGTRPEIIKMSPILREAGRRGLPLRLIHSGQHYDENMSASFFRDLGLGEPDFTLRGRGLPVDALASLLRPVLAELGLGSLFVHGDTNTALAGAIAARAQRVPVAHVEAGLRCSDLRMVEEQNRRRIDALSRWLFVPTKLQLDNLRREGLLTDDRRAFVVGNTIVDALAWMMPRLDRTTPLRASTRRPILLTLHRAENSSPATVERVLGLAAKLAAEHSCEVLWPVHPRMQQHVAELPAGVRVLPALGWRLFLRLMRDSRLVLTDSGGLQEEAMILRKPCVTLRTSTERPETLLAGANCLVDLNASPEELSSAVRLMLRSRVPAHPWGVGDSAKRILDLFTRDLTEDAQAVGVDRVPGSEMPAEGPAA